MKKGEAKVNLPGDAGVVRIERKAMGTTENLEEATLTFSAKPMPLALAFVVPIPPKPQAKLELFLESMKLPLPDLKVDPAKLGAPIPKAQAAEAKKTFAAKKLFFIWSEKPLYEQVPGTVTIPRLRWAPNPDVKFEDLPLGDEAVALRAKMVATLKGKNAPYTTTSSSLGFSFPRWSQNYEGVGTETVTMIRGVDRNAPDAKKMDQMQNGPPISNACVVQVKFSK